MPDPQPGEPDPRTLARFMAGDITALATVFRLYGPRIYRLARKMMGNQADAEDATQEIFVRAFERAHSFHGRSGLFTWLYRLAVRHCLNAIKRRRRRESHERAAWAALRGASEARPPSPIRRLMGKEESEVLDELLRALPPGYWACVVLREMEGLSYAQIGELLEIPVGTVMSRLARARRLLRAGLLRSEESGVHPRE